MTRILLALFGWFALELSCAQVPQEKWVRITQNNSEDFHPTFSPDGQSIVFDSQRSGHREVYVSKADGSTVSPVTAGTTDSDHPRWFPDGRILFESVVDGQRHLFSIRVDGTGLQTLPVGGGGIVSPNGTAIVYAVWQEKLRWDIFLMNADGTNVRRITDNHVENFGHTWSSDSQLIMFTTVTQEQGDLYVDDRAGHVRPITTHPADDRDGHWCSNDSRIVFCSNRDGNYEIYSMNSEGGDLRRLTNSTSNESELAVSPDGRHVLFIRGEEQDAEIFVMDIAGRQVRQITKNHTREAVPAWSPNGKQITFVSEVSGNLEVYVLNL